MNEQFRQTLIGLIWPGPIAGPLPVNLFRILAPVLVFYHGPIISSLIMSVISSLLAVFYFVLLELTEGKNKVEELLKRLPEKTHHGIEKRGPAALFATSLLVGVFPYAIFLKLLRYPKAASEILLVASSIVGSFVWTGIFWGSAIEIIKRAVNFAF